MKYDRRITMNKIDELLNQRFTPSLISTWKESLNSKNYTTGTVEIYWTLYASIQQCMKRYAEEYAKKCLEIAAENAVALERDYNDDWHVDTNSILNIELPSHD